MSIEENAKTTGVAEAAPRPQVSVDIRDDGGEADRKLAEDMKAFEVWFERRSMESPISQIFLLGYLNAFRTVGEMSRLQIGDAKKIAKAMAASLGSPEAISRLEATLQAMHEVMLDTQEAARSENEEKGG